MAASSMNPRNINASSSKALVPTHNLEQKGNDVKPRQRGARAKGPGLLEFDHQSVAEGYAAVHACGDVHIVRGHHDREARRFHELRER